MAKRIRPLITRGHHSVLGTWTGESLTVCLVRAASNASTVGRPQLCARQIAALKSAGCLLLATATSLAEARAVEVAGVDISGRPARCLANGFTE
jgi:hypothetical protein